MKRMIICLVTAMLLVSLMAIPTFAADAATESGIYDLTKVSNSVDQLKAQTASGTEVQGKTVSIGGTETTLYPDAEKVYLTYTGAVQNGFYFLVAKDDENVPTESNLVYVNQETASGSTVEFTLYPSKLESGKTYYIQISSNANGGQQLTTVASFKYYEYVPYTLGDVDGKDGITAVDALLALQIAGKLYAPTENERLAADVDLKDGVTAIDALRILQYAGKIIDSWDD